MERRQSLKPFPFEKMMQNTAMFKQHETIDGLAINVMFPLGNQFQLGGMWTLSNTKGANFEITSSVNNHNGSPMMSPDEVHNAVFRSSSDGSSMVMGNINLPYKWIL